MRIVICDDIAEDRMKFRQAFKEIGRKILEDKFEIYEFASGEDLLAAIQEEKIFFDVIFLDIFMRGMTGMEVAQKIRGKGKKYPIVFLTTSRDFAVESYEVDAFGYLLKPFSEEKLKKIIESLTLTTEKVRICVQSNRQRRYISLEDILYVETIEHRTIIHLVKGEPVSCYEKMKDLEKKLSDIRFLKCNQSYLINMDYVATVENDFIMKNNARLPIRIRDRKEITDKYYDYFVSKTVAGLKGGKEYDV